MAVLVPYANSCNSLRFLNAPSLTVGISRSYNPVPKEKPSTRLVKVLGRHSLDACAESSLTLWYPGSISSFCKPAQSQKSTHECQACLGARTQHTTFTCQFVILTCQVRQHTQIKTISWAHNLCQAVACVLKHSLQHHSKGGKIFLEPQGGQLSCCLQDTAT